MLKCDGDGESANWYRKVVFSGRPSIGASNPMGQWKALESGVGNVVLLVDTRYEAVTCCDGVDLSMR